MSAYSGPVNPNPAPGEARIIIYGYIPSLPLAIVGVVTFFVILVGNVYHVIKRKGYRTFHTLLAIGSLMEMGGYAARIASHKKPFVVGAFVAQYFLIVVAPVLFSAAIYLSLSLTVRSVNGSQGILILRPKIILALFITADVFTTIIQVVGAGLIGASESATVRGRHIGVTPDQASDILIAGLAVQTFSFLAFVTILSIAILRVGRSNEVADLQPLEHRRLKSILMVVMATSDLILLRTVFRLAESAQGFFGFASTHETLFGTLEYMPVIVALLIWTGLPPARFLEGRGEGTGQRDEKGTRSVAVRAGEGEQKGSRVLA